MIDFYNLLVQRLIIHTINAKEHGSDTASVDASNEISKIDDNVLGLIKDRLINAAGRNSKAFELEIENSQPNSFFDLSSGITDLEEDDFIQRTVEIAELLAESQRSVSIPGGFLLILDCKDDESNLPIIIVIKAEPHEALQFSKNGEQTQVNVLRKVFLSPSQKLYKIGIIYNKTKDDTENLNEQFGCFLYDDQFRTDSHPAEYFYKDFLGFSVGNNAKIQSQRFYSKTERFILKDVRDVEIKANLYSALKNEFSTNQNSTVTPRIFAETFIPTEEGLRDIYKRSVCQELPSSFVKDDSLISRRLAKRSIGFPNKIIVTGPEEVFDNRVEIIDDVDVLKNLEPDNPDYTIVKISGKPYSLNE